MFISAYVFDSFADEVCRCISVGSDAGVGDGEGGEKVVQTVGVGVKRWIQLHASCLVHGLCEQFFAVVHKGPRDRVLCPKLSP